MAASLYSTIRLDTDLTGSVPTNTYRVLWESDLRMYEPAVTTERSLTGKMHIHKVLDGSDPMVFDGRRYKLLIGASGTEAHAELSQLSADLAKVVYFMPHYRDESDVATYRSVMFFRSLRDVRAIDPNETYYEAVIELEEATGNSVS